MLEIWAEKNTRSFFSTSVSTFPCLDFHLTKLLITIVVSTVKKHRRESSGTLFFLREKKGSTSYTALARALASIRAWAFRTSHRVRSSWSAWHVPSCGNPASWRWMRSRGLLDGHLGPWSMICSPGWTKGVIYCTIQSNIVGNDRSWRNPDFQSIIDESSIDDFFFQVYIWDHHSVSEKGNGDVDPQVHCSCMGLFYPKQLANFGGWNMLKCWHTYTVHRYSGYLLVSCIFLPVFVACVFCFLCVIPSYFDEKYRCFTLFTLVKSSSTCWRSRAELTKPPTKRFRRHWNVCPKGPHCW